MSAYPDLTNKVTLASLARKKREGKKITMLTAYDYPMALLVDGSGVDLTLVGDSLGMEELGFDTTLPVTMEIMLHHTKAVRRGTRRALLVADLPFLSYQVNADEAIRNAGRLLQEGEAAAVKLEGGVSIAPTIKRIVDAGIPVMGHIGFTPQSVNLLGVRKQGKDEAGAAQVLADARAVQEAGAFAVVLELIPEALAAEVTAALSIPTIGIGAGPSCDGQVLVTSDLIGLRPERSALKHVRQYTQVGAAIAQALASYREEVETSQFP
ncbi:MAG: 3-methyl-2-oxobutanoate hydroxymethyltransferase [Janthinobacterium lividum]